MSTDSLYEAATAPPPGSRVRIRGEEWAVQRCLPLPTGGHAVYAGEPLPRNLLAEKLGEKLGSSEFGLTTVLNRLQFVRVDEDRIGLLARDVPGSTNAIAEAGDHVEALLMRRGRGLSQFHVHAEVATLSEDHTRWSPQMTTSVLRSDGRFRTSQSGAVGLAVWESIRVPTRRELIRGALRESEGRVSVEAVVARIEAHYGEPPTRASLFGMAAMVGARVDGDWLVEKD